MISAREPEIRSPGRGKALCGLARKYLLGFRGDGVTESVLDLYLAPRQDKLRQPTLQGVYLRLLESAQNANMRHGVVGASIGGVSALGPLLFNFDPAAVSRGFPGGWEELLDLIENRLSPHGRIRRTSRSIWPLYCRAVLTGAEFLAQFPSADAFYAWVNIFDQDDRIRPALPMLLSHEIAGFGFALACDFLKELGYLNFGKPDVHVKYIFRGVGLTPARANDYETFKAIIWVARDAGLSPYHVDKLFWLVGSGYFYKDLMIGRKGRVRTSKDAFIKLAKSSGTSEPTAHKGPRTVRTTRRR